MSFTITSDSHQAGVLSALAEGCSLSHHTLVPILDSGNNRPAICLTLGNLASSVLVTKPVFATIKISSSPRGSLRGCHVVGGN